FDAEIRRHEPLNWSNEPNFHVGHCRHKLCGYWNLPPESLSGRQRRTNSIWRRSAVPWRRLVHELFDLGVAEVVGEGVELAVGERLRGAGDGSPGGAGERAADADPAHASGRQILQGELRWP